MAESWNTSGCWEEHFTSEGLEIYHVASFVLVILISSFGLISHSIVIVALNKVNIKTSTDVFLIGLSAFEVGLIITMALSENHYIHLHILKPGIQTLTMGKIATTVQPLKHAIRMMATMCMVAMSFDRYLSVCHPLKFRNRCTPRRARVQLIAMIPIALVFNIPLFYEYLEILGRGNVLDVCEGEILEIPSGYLRNDIEYVWTYTFTLYIIFLYIAPLTMLSFTTYHLIRSIRKHMGFQRNLTKAVRKSAPDTQAIRMLVIVTLVFTVCQIPDMCVQVVSRLYVQWEFEDTARTIAYNFLLVNSSMSMVIYTCSSRRFKRHLMHILPKCCRSRKIDLIQSGAPVPVLPTVSANVVE